MSLCMVCNRKSAVFMRSYSGEKLCARCFRKSIEDKVRATISKYEMLKPDDRIMVAVSGGKDSVVLLHLLAKMEKAFSEATLLLIREKQEIKDYHLKLKNKHGKARALAIISHKLGRAVYYMIKNNQAFDLQHFLRIKDRAA